MWRGCHRVAGVAGVAGVPAAAAAAAAVAAEAASTAEELMRCQVLGNPPQVERPAAGPVPAGGCRWSDPSTDR